MRAKNDYDTTIKKVLTKAGSVLLRSLTGCDTVRWLNVELHRKRALRVDLLGRRPDSRLIHIEIQSANEKNFWIRMGTYGFLAAEEYGEYPDQLVLYVGTRALRIPNDIATPHFRFRFPVFDIRSLPTRPLLESPNPGDNVIALLTRDGASDRTVRRVLQRIAEAAENERRGMLEELVAVAGLRRLGTVVRREIKRMPALEQLMKNDVIGPPIRAAHARGVRKGHSEGQRTLLLRQVESRFGAIPAETRRRIESLRPPELEAAALRVLTVRRIDDLLT